MDLSKAEIEFGETYRNIYGEFIKTGKVSRLKDWSSLKNNEFNRISQNGIESRKKFTNYFINEQIWFFPRMFFNKSNLNKIITDWRFQKFQHISVINFSKVKFMVNIVMFMTKLTIGCWSRALHLCYDNKFLRVKLCDQNSLSKSRNSFHILKKSAHWLISSE